MGNDKHSNYERSNPVITIGQFNDSYPPVMDGVSNTVKNYAYWMNKNYGKCYVVTPAFPKHKDEDEFKVLRYRSIHFPMRPPYRLGIPKLDFHVKKDLMKIDFDILHVHSPFSSGQLALKLAKKRNIPIVATFHSKFYDDFKQSLKSDILAKLLVKHVISFYNKVDYVWTVNYSTAQTLRDYGYHGRIEIMPNGCDFNSSIDFKQNEIYMNENYHIKKDVPVFLFVGQHIWQKNIKLIVESLHLLKEQHFPFKMFFIGEGYAKNQITQLVNRLGLRKEISFIGKVMDRETLKQFYAKADLFIFPSVYDNAPIVIREAAALKTASLVIEGTNAQEGIIDNYNGFTCLENAEHIANKIKKIFDNIELLKTVGQNANETITKSWEKIVETVNTRYLEMIDDYHKTINKDIEKRIISNV